MNETLLHPGDAFTAYTFKKGEWSYNQAPTPYPSWAWWGITDWLTTELDFEAWLGGVPSLNFRIALLKQKDWMPAIAYETMFQFINEEFDQMENLSHLDLKRKGSNWYNHINLSWQFGEKLHLHLSGGCTFAESLSISNGNASNFVGDSLKEELSPDYSISFDWRVNKWLSINPSASYGSTFLYIDNIARKQQFVAATRVAPFIYSKKVFFNSFRFEVAFLHAYFKDAKESVTGPIAFVYWQWDWSKKNRKKRRK